MLQRLALYLTQALVLIQFPFFQKTEPKPEQQLSMYSKPAVVRILAGCYGTYYYQPENSSYVTEYPFSHASAGTGYFVDPNGYIVTNAHVVEPAKGGEDACKQRLFENLVQKLTGERDLSKLSESRI
ncbi:MAG: hypothetical protein SFY66_11190 [Oculatellaceae cyanobacterium bins.114]|nr:hypothetical protein [Oculatellaceae cyanobacterium bins.114]